MDRRSLIKRAGLAGVAATIAAPAVHAQATVRWRLAHSFSRNRSTRSTARPRPSQSSYPTCRAGNSSFRFFGPGELVPAIRDARCRAERDGRMHPHRLELLRRQGRDLRFQRHPVQPQLAPDVGLDVRRQRAETDARVLPQLWRDQFSDGEYRSPDGRLVPQGDKLARRSEGPEDARFRPCRGDGVPASRHRAPDHRRAAISTRRWNAARSMRSSLPARSTTRSSASTRSRPIIIIRVGTTEVRSSISSSG